MQQAFVNPRPSTNYAAKTYQPQTPAGHAAQAYAQAKAGKYGEAAKSLGSGAEQIVTAPVTAPFKAIGSALTAAPDIYSAYQLGGTSAAIESYLSHFPVLGPAIAAGRTSDVKTATTEETYAKWGDVGAFGTQAVVDWAAVVAGFGKAVPDTSGALRFSVRGPRATPSLAWRIANVEPTPVNVQRTVALLETKEGPTIVAGGASDLSPAQVEFAKKLGLVPVESPGEHAEPTAIWGAGELRLTPTRGVSTNVICGMCAGEITDMGGVILGKHRFYFPQTMGGGGK